MYNLNLDDAVNFLLTKSRDDKENSSKYLAIIKLLYSTQISWPQIVYDNHNYNLNYDKKDNPIDWTVTSTNSASNVTDVSLKAENQDKQNYDEINSHEVLF